MTLNYFFGTLAEKSEKRLLRIKKKITSGIGQLSTVEKKRLVAIEKKRIFYLTLCISIDILVLLRETFKHTTEEIMELQKTKEAYAAVIIDKGEQAEPTSRCLPAHLEGYTEWREEGAIDGVPVYVYYMTTEGDAELAIDGSDWSYVDWEARVDRIEIDEVQCDRDEIAQDAIDALIKKYGV